MALSGPSYTALGVAGAQHWYTVESSADIPNH